MSNGAACCALGLCCPPLSVKQRDAIAEELVHDGFDQETALKVATWLQNTYDIAPHGSLTEFKAKMVGMMRGKKDKDE